MSQSADRPRVVLDCNVLRHVFDYARAAQDEPYIDLAAAAGADFLVSRDRDLLSLSTDHSLLGKQFRQSYPRLQILDPEAFLKIMAPEE